MLVNTWTLQFAYQADIGVDDAITYMLNKALTHL